MTLVWTAIGEFYGKNKWLVYLIVLTGAVYAFGNTIVSCVAYFHPKQINNTYIINKTTTIDRTLTTRRETVKPDGTRELLETIRADVNNISENRDMSNSVKEPVALGGGGKWGVLALYEPFSRSLGAGVSYDLNGSLSLAVSHQVVIFDSPTRYPQAFNPSFSVGWRFR